MPLELGGTKKQKKCKENDEGSYSNSGNNVNLNILLGELKNYEILQWEAQNESE